MARRITLTWAKKKVLHERLEKLPDKAKVVVGGKLMQQGREIKNTMKSFLRAVAYDEGVLHDSVEMELSKDRLSLTVGPRAVYLRAHGRPINLPRWIEFGTRARVAGQKTTSLGKRGKVRQRRAADTNRGRPATPYVAPTWALYKKKVRREMGAAVTEQLKKHIAGK